MNLQRHLDYCVIIQNYVTNRGSVNDLNTGSLKRKINVEVISSAPLEEPPINIDTSQKSPVSSLDGEYGIDEKRKLLRLHIEDFQPDSPNASDYIPQFDDMSLILSNLHEPFPSSSDTSISLNNAFKLNLPIETNVLDHIWHNDDGNSENKCNQDSSMLEKIRNIDSKKHIPFNPSQIFLS